MIISVDYMRQFRPIAKNIDDNRVAMYIEEAEHFDVVPVIGAELYQRYQALGVIEVDAEGNELQDENGDPIYSLMEGDLPTDEYKLLNGGYYTDECGTLQRFEGLRVAVAYLAYARFIRNQSINVTPFGVVQKVSDESTPTSDRNIAAAAADAERVGKAYLLATIKYWRMVTGECIRPRRSTYTAIGK